MKKSAVLLAVIMMATIVFSGCSTTTSKTEGDVIKIGVFEPITGANAAGGELEANGIKLANKLYPEVLGKKVELVIADNKSDKVEAATAAARLVEKDKVTAIIGSWWSSLSMAAGDIVKQGKVPAVGVTCTNPLVTADNPFYFRVCFIDPFQGTVMANYAFSKLGAKKAAIIQEVSNDYAVGLANFFTESFKKYTGDEKCILSVSNYNTGDTDFSAQLTNIKSQNPDVIFAPGNYTESALIITKARELGITCPIIGGDTWGNQAFLDIGKTAVEGAAFSSFFDEAKPANDKTKKFIEEFKKQYPNSEVASESILGFDAYLLLLDAIEKAGSTDGEKIREQLAKTKDFEGAAGIISLDENRNAIRSAVIKTVKDGKFKYLDSVDPK